MHTLEWRQRRSEVMKGENNPRFGKEPWNKGTKGLCKPNIGSFKKGSSGFIGKHTEETKKKISKNRKGKNIGEDHPMYGKHHTEETKQKLRQATLKKKQHIGSKNVNWKGDDVGYYALHAWLRRKLGTANKCYFNLEHKSTRFHWANISGSYLRDIEDYTSLCPTCHKQYDMIRRGRVSVR